MSIRTRILPTLLSCSLILSACEGGLIGTGTGPKDNPSTINLDANGLFPGKISPDLPLVLTETSGTYSNAPLPSEITVSQNWVTLNRVLSQFESRRLAIKTELILLSNVFDEVETKCGVPVSDVCLIEQGVISAYYTDEVITQIIDLYVSTTPDLAAQDLSQQVQLQRGNRLDFGQLSLEWTAGKSKPHRLKISPLTLLPEADLVLTWSEDGSRVDFKIVENGIGDNYYYQRSAFAQQLTIAVHGDVADTQTTPTIRLSRDIDNSGEVLISAQLSNDRITGQVNDEAVFLQTASFSKSTDRNAYRQEIIQTGGDVQDSAECEFPDMLEECLPVGTSTIELYISAEEVQVAESSSGFNQVTIYNLPDDINRFEILSTKTSLSLENRQIFCYGWKSPIAEVPDIYCVADLSSVQNVSVSAFDSFDNRRFLLEPEVEVDGRKLTVISGD